MSFEISKVDVEARKKAANQIRKSFLKIVKEVEKGKTPAMIIPKRTLSNTVYDNVRRLLLLGEEKLRRELTNMGEAKKFMQTMLMASIIYKALVENEYPTIRDLYYRGKHTIKYVDYKGRLREEETWSEQKESDSVIRDIEVITGLLRENMLILSKEKGKIVGNMKIKSGDDVIDLSKMGHGAYAIESTPDLIEFKDVDAEYVLVVEKDAVFQQLHRVGYWKKHKALLVTSAGQPDRATRRFVRRIHEELDLPVYILTDSIPADEVVIVRNSLTGKVMIGPVEELIGNYFTPGEKKERVTPPIGAPSWNPQTGKIEWTPIGYAYRHKINEEILEIETRGRGTVKVTKAHSLFVFRDGKIQVIPAKDIKPGDHILVASKLPSPEERKSPIVIQVKESVGAKEFKTVMNGKSELVALSKGRNYIPGKVVLDEELSWLLGIYTAEGSTAYSRYINLSFNKEEINYVEKVQKILKDMFGLKPYLFYRKDKPEIRVWIGSSIVYDLFKSLKLATLTRMKQIPEEIINSSKRVMLSYIKGLIDGDGHIDEYGDIIVSTRSTILSKQLVNILLMLGIQPSVVENKEDIIIRIGKSTQRTPSEIYEYLAGRIINSSSTPGLKTEPTYGMPIDNELRKILIHLANNGKVSFKPSQKTISKAKLKKIKNLSDKLPSDYNYFVDSDVALVKVKSIKITTYEGYVYDFAVPKGNNFVGGYGVIYHNSDPYGWYIYSVFKIGSITLSYESERLATPAAKFLGVSMTDVFGEEPLLNRKDVLSKIFGSKYKYILDGKKPFLTPAERRNYIIKAKPQDLARAAELIGTKTAKQFLGKPVKIKTSRGERSKEHGGYEWFQTSKWIKEIGIFFLTQAKLEIEAMASRGLKFLAFEYIPTKIETGDWID